MNGALPEPGWAWLETIGAAAKIEGITVSLVDGG